MLPHALLITVLAGIHGGALLDTKATLPAAGLEFQFVNGSVAWTPAIDYVRYRNKDADVLIGHLNVAYQRSFSSGRFVWIGAGESLAYLKGAAAGSTGYPNADLGFGIRRGQSEIYLSARSVDFFIPVFRDSWAGHGVLVAIGARRALNRPAKPAGEGARRYTPALASEAWRTYIAAHESTRRDAEASSNNQTQRTGLHGQGTPPPL